MATARPRTGRGLIKDDANEERDMWKTLLVDGKKVDALVSKMDIASQRIVEVEDQQAAALARNELPPSSLDTELENLYRSTLKHTEEATHILETKNDPFSIMAALKVLAALREASESEPQANLSSAPMSRSSSTAKPPRDRKRKHETSSNGGSGLASSTSATITEDTEAKSPAPITVGTSPKVALGGSKLNTTKPQQRSGSVASTRDGSVSVKIEDVGETSSLDGSSATKEPASSTSTATSGGPANPLVTPTAAKPMPKLTKGAEVLYRNKKRDAEGSGILCTITSIVGEGKQRRYEIQDADPEPDPTTGQIQLPWRASVHHLIPIPAADDTLALAHLPDLENRKQVLALYPQTTTFYRAEVSREWRAGKEGEVGVGGLVRLMFEGEDEKDKEQDVERRYVLTEGLK
ncbi:MAG: SAGA HAT/Core module component [Bogoriella megaspora]|nr:MAG: SAGA HAT/Core module component [Bogoriella megaspora]